MLLHHHNALAHTALSIKNFGDRKIILIELVFPSVPDLIPKLIFQNIEKRLKVKTGGHSNYPNEGGLRIWQAHN